MLSLVELCCCKVAPEKTAAQVAGWCIPAGDCRTAEKIAIRLRTPKGKGHCLLDFESVFGTMLHELAHIVHSKHTPAFYQLMDELQKDWERLEAAGQVLDEQGFPTVGGQRIDASHNPSTLHVRALALAAAEKRARVNGIMSSQKLGYGNEPNWKKLLPRERAARAAERRAIEAALGFGDEEEPHAVTTASASTHASIPPPGSRLDTNTVPPKRRRQFCNRNSCKCGQCSIGTSESLSANISAQAEEDRLLQLAIAASLEHSIKRNGLGSKAKEPSGDSDMFQSCIVLSDDDIDSVCPKKPGLLMA